MNYVKLTTILIVFFVAVGCENKDLVQCRQDVVGIQSQLDAKGRELVRLQGEMTQILDEMMRGAERQKDIESQLKRQYSENVEQRKSSQAKLDDTMRALMAAKAENRELRAQVTEFASQIVETENSLQAKQQMLELLGKQIDQFKAEKDQLKEIVADLQQKSSAAAADTEP